MKKNLLASSVLLEVLRGYSVLDCGGKDVFFKHFYYCDYLALDEYEYKQFKVAVKNGIKTEEKLIETAISKNYWSKALEEKIQSLEWMISKSEQAASKITDNIQKLAFEKSISKQRDELSQLKNKRLSIVQYSAENCAAGKRSSKLLEESLFYDKEFYKPLQPEDLASVIDDFKIKLSQLNNEDNLLRAAFDNSFFDIFSMSYRDPLSIIKRDIFNITVLQKNLLGYAHLLLNKLKNVDMPEDVKRDPRKILEFSKSETDSAKKSEGVEDLREKMAKRGGKLKAEDLLS